MTVAAASHAYYDLQLRKDAAGLVEGEWYQPLFEVYTAALWRKRFHDLISNDKEELNCPFAVSTTGIFGPCADDQGCWVEGFRVMIRQLSGAI